ncbi:Molybdopterin molybdenumtransferase [Methylobacterium bullatum]|uniref:Molybdopterin molybdenumtransferase n=1 Tax=Methylobacterium bullatum TaxID=570505 RepID=A0A679ISM2_9HYPH|nr:Molybdopterin molybdenumtransferase [Methylobacterium bullatum]
MPLDEALARLLAAAPVATILVPLGEGIGFVLAEDVVALTDRPAEPRARRDGWAVAAGDVTGASPYAPVTLRGPPPWVEDGDALPPRTDTVLTPDAVGADGDIVSDAAQGEGVSRVGQEVARGDVLAQAGERLTPLRALSLLSAGIDTVLVRRPRLHIVGIGPGSASAVAGWASEAGVRITASDSERDAGAIAAALRVDGADAVFVVGGTGFGRTDHSAEALARAGRLDAHGIALHPGESAGFGRIGAVPVLLVPGRPDAALAVVLALGRPLLARLSGAIQPEGVKGRLTRKIASTVGMSEIVFVRRTREGVEPTGGGDLPLRRLILAEGAVLVPPEREGYPEGEWIEIVPL